MTVYRWLAGSVVLAHAIFVLFALFGASSFSGDRGSPGYTFRRLAGRSQSRTRAGSARVSGLDRTGVVVKFQHC